MDSFRKFAHVARDTQYNSILSNQVCDIILIIINLTMEIVN